MFSLNAIFAALSLSGLAFASLGPRATLNISNANISPDGFTRSAVLAGTTFPGPPIVGQKGDNFRINVVNSLADITMLKTTSIHWHGLFQKGTAWADGAGFVTQCPIASGDSFLYNFDVPDQAGTFWYHSHIGNQYCDGLRGAFVVHDPYDPHMSMYDEDNENTIITLADWYHVPSPQQGLPHTPNATLINGLGRYDSGPASPLAVIGVVSGKRYRFRLISISCDPDFVFSIDGHQLTVIEADGDNVVPVTVDSIDIFAGQRYSFVLNATQPVDNYWIRANPSSGPQGFLGGLNSAILRYRGAPVADPITTAGLDLVQLEETSLHPFDDPAAPGLATADGADVTLTLTMGFDFTTGQFTINGVPFVVPSVPVLLQILSGTTDPSALLPQGSIIPLPLNSTIQITIPGGLAPGPPHPFHLHGHSFSVIRSAGSSTYNYANPVRRDVVNTGLVGDEVTIRFETNNPGPWFIHCHIDWHLNRGLAVVLAEDIPGMQAAIPVPPDWGRLCPIYNNLTAEDIGGIVP